MKNQYPITFRLLQRLAQCPLPVLRGLGRAIGHLAYYSQSSRKRITQRNLEIAFPELDSHRLKQLTHAHLLTMGQALIDRIWLWFAPMKTIRKRITLSGFEHLPSTLSSDTKTTPTILFVPHFAGLETAWPAWVIACEQANLPAPKLCTIFQPQASVWEDALFRYGRGRFGQIDQFTRHDGIRPIIQSMRRGNAYYCLPDNDFGSDDAVFVPFFGELAATLTVLPRLSQILKADVIPILTRLTPQGYHVEVFPKWQAIHTLDIPSACAAMNEMIEIWATQTPEQYLFSHRRYKTRPQGTAPIYPSKKT